MVIIIIIIIIIIINYKISKQHTGEALNQGNTENSHFWALHTYCGKYQPKITELSTWEITYRVPSIVTIE
jgi:hypothetical protein